MVLAAKVFTVGAGLSLPDIAHRLRGYGLIEREELLGRELEVGSRISELEIVEDTLRGTFEENFIISTTYKDEVFKAPLTVRTYFEFHLRGDIIYLVVAAKKARANRIANQLSSLLSAERGVIQEARISPDTLRRFFEERMETVKVVFFDDVRLPNVDKLSLYGSQLANTGLYQEYLKLGKVWYVVFEPEDGLVIGLTRNCVVTFFSKLSLEDALKFIRENILPLVE